MEPPSTSRPLIVVVDDDPWLLRLLADHFEMHDLQCRCHPTAEDYLASSDVTQTRCLVLDANLPGMGGLDLQRILLERHITFPIIFHTGQIDPRTEASAREAGAAAFLEKAASPSNLIEAISHALAIHPV